MKEEIDFILDSAKEAMEAAIVHLEKEFVKIRAGKASPAMLSSVMVEYYGSQTPLSQVSNINTPDGRTITVQPWEKGMLPEIEKAILNARSVAENTELFSALCILGPSLVHIANGKLKINHHTATRIKQNKTASMLCA